MRRHSRLIMSGIGFLFIATVLNAQDVVVLFDISGSMSAKQQVAYTQEFHERLADILLRGGADPNIWQVTAPEPVP